MRRQRIVQPLHVSLFDTRFDVGFDDADARRLRFPLPLRTALAVACLVPVPQQSSLSSPSSSPLPAAPALHTSRAPLHTICVGPVVRCCRRQICCVRVCTARERMPEGWPHVWVEAWVRSANALCSRARGVTRLGTARGRWYLRDRLRTRRFAAAENSQVVPR